MTQFHCQSQGLKGGPGRNLSNTTTMMMVKNDDGNEDDDGDLRDSFRL